LIARQNVGDEHIADRRSNLDKLETAVVAVSERVPRRIRD
jgi:hypothetical protein